MMTQEAEPLLEPFRHLTVLAELHLDRKLRGNLDPSDIVQQSFLRAYSALAEVRRPRARGPGRVAAQNPDWATGFATRSYRLDRLSRRSIALELEDRPGAMTEEFTKTIVQSLAVDGPGSVRTGWPWHLLGVLDRVDPTVATRLLAAALVAETDIGARRGIASMLATSARRLDPTTAAAVLGTVLQKEADAEGLNESDGPGRHQTVVEVVANALAIAAK